MDAVAWQALPGRRGDRGQPLPGERALAGEGDLAGHETREEPGERIAFDFVTRVEPGEHDPETKVLVIDYAPVDSNPGFVIKSIRDELVEIVPGANLGKVLYRNSDGSYANWGFFALRPAAA